jgi:hypothetical protein
MRTSTPGRGPVHVGREGAEPGSGGTLVVNSTPRLPLGRFPAKAFTDGTSLQRSEPGICRTSGISTRFHRRDIAPAVGAAPDFPGFFLLECRFCRLGRRLPAVVPNVFAEGRNERLDCHALSTRYGSHRPSPRAIHRIRSLSRWPYATLGRLSREGSVRRSMKSGRLVWKLPVDDAHRVPRRMAESLGPGRFRESGAREPDGERDRWRRSQG